MPYLMELERAHLQPAAQHRTGHIQPFPIPSPGGYARPSSHLISVLTSNGQPSLFFPPISYLTCHHNLSARFPIPIFSFSHLIHHSIHPELFGFSVLLDVLVNLFLGFSSFHLVLSTHTRPPSSCIDFFWVSIAIINRHLRSS